MNQEKAQRIKALTDKINELPKGYISIKNIGGNVYYYHQWSEDGKKYSKYLNDDELLTLNKLLALRRSLEEELKELKNGSESNDILYCSLMHSNQRVVDLTISLITGQIQSVGLVYSNEHLPIGVNDNINSIFEWWNDRSVPLTRSGIKDALEKLNISDPRILLIKCYGLSLSDQYWIKPKDEDIAWEDINFFHKFIIARKKLYGIPIILNYFFKLYSKFYSDKLRVGLQGENTVLILQCQMPAELTAPPTADFWRCIMNAQKTGLLIY